MVPPCSRTMDESDQEPDDEKLALFLVSILRFVTRSLHEFDLARSLLDSIWRVNYWFVKRRTLIGMSFKENLVSVCIRSIEGLTTETECF